MANKKLPLRIATFNKPPIISVVNKGGGEQNCKFSATFGQAANDLIKYGNFNCTVFVTSEEEGYGHLNHETGMYDGMHGVVQRNKSDLGLCLEGVPLEVDEFKYGPVLSASRITVGSIFRDEAQFDDLSIADSVKDVSSETWFVFIGLLTIFWGLLSLGKWILSPKDPTSSYWTIVTFVCNEETFEVPGVFFRTFSIIITLLIFYSLQYFSNFMKTELVQPQYPVVIESLEDILKYKFHPDYGLIEKSLKRKEIRSKYPKLDESKFIDLKPTFTRQMRTISLFMNEPEGSVRKRIYDEALRVYGSHEKTLFSFDMRNMAATADLLRNEVVLIEAQPILQLIRVMACTAMALERDRGSNSILAKSSAWYARNVSIPLLMGYVYSGGIEEDVRNRLDTYMYKTTESGIVHVLTESIATAFTPITPKMYSCMKDEMRLTIPEIEHLEMKHTTSVFWFASGMHFLALSILTLEIFKFMIGKKFKKIRRTKFVTRGPPESSRVQFKNYLSPHQNSLRPGPLNH